MGHEIVTVDLDEDELHQFKSKAKTANEKSEIINQRLLERIKDDERSFYPAIWAVKVLVTLCLGIFIFLVLFEIVIYGFSIISRLPMIALYGLITSIIIYWFSQRKDKRKYSTRLNAFGMMVTDNSKKTWYSWDMVNNIHISKDVNAPKILFRFGDSNKADFFSDYYGDAYASLPGNYNISPSKMIEYMNHFKREYERLNLRRYSELEMDMILDPPQPSTIFSWGRLGAINKIGKT